MITLDRIRLTGLLRKKPWRRGFFYRPDSPATRQARPQGQADCGLRGTARRGRPAWRLGRAGYEPLRETEVDSRSRSRRGGEQQPTTHRNIGTLLAMSDRDPPTHASGCQERVQNVARASECQGRPTLRLT